MFSVDPAFVVIGVAIVVGLMILSAVEMVPMRLLGIAERPKNIWYPILANLITFLVMTLVVGLFEP